jgi:hypothetical protein
VSGEFTDVGPPDEHDLPRKKSRFFEWLWRRSLFAGLFNLSWGFGGALAIFRIREMEQRGEMEEKAEAEAKHPWHGLQEAELSEEERNLAVRRMAREEGLRKARGD